MLIKDLEINLQHFDEGDTGEGAATVNQGSNEPVGAQQEVIYGIQDNGDDGRNRNDGDNDSSKENSGQSDKESNDNQNIDNTKPTKEERQSNYLKLKAEYKDLFDNDVKAQLDDRFKRYIPLEERLTTIEPLMDALSEKYGTTDINTIIAKERESSIEEMALKANMDVDSYREYQKLRETNKNLERQLKDKERVLGEAKAREQLVENIRNWRQQETALKEIYPDFSLDVWYDNEKFSKLLNLGVDIKTAYETLNIENIKANIAKSQEKKVVETIKARGARPSENGSKQKPGAIIKSNVNTLTRADRAAIAERVRRGETIKF